MFWNTTKNYELVNAERCQWQIKQEDRRFPIDDASLLIYVDSSSALLNIIQNPTSHDMYEFIRTYACISGHLIKLIPAKITAYFDF